MNIISIVFMNLLQELDLQDSCKCLSSMEKNKYDTTLPPPSLKSLLPPPPPRSVSSTPSLDSRKGPLPPHPPKSMHPAPPPPKFDSSVSDDSSNRLSFLTVPGSCRTSLLFYELPLYKERFFCVMLFVFLQFLCYTPTF